MVPVPIFQHNSRPFPSTIQGEFKATDPNSLSVNRTIKENQF